MDVRHFAAATLPSLLIVLLGLAALPAGARTDEPHFDAGDPRSLPSLEIEWRWRSRYVPRMVVDDGVVYAIGLHRITALDAASGQVLWDRRLERPEKGGFAGEPVLLRERLAVVFGADVHLLDRRTGVTVGTQRFEHRVELTGPPLVAKTPRGEGTELVRLDPATGEPLARRTFDAQIHRFTAHRGTVVAPLVRKVEGDYRTTLVGLAPDDLTTRWELPIRGGHSLQEIDGELYVDVHLDREKTAGNDDGLVSRITRYFTLAARAGELGDPLPEREADEGFSDLGWELRMWQDGGALDESARLRRYDRETGEALWTLGLPATPGPRARLGDRLYVHCYPRSQGRGFLAEIGWDDGRLHVLAYGLRSVNALAVHRDLLIAATGSGVVAFRAGVYGPPEAATRLVADEVERIVSYLDGLNRPYLGAQSDLQTLGPEALPLLAERVEQLRPTAIQVLAEVLGAARYRPAAPALGRVLAKEAVKAKPEEPGRSPVPALLRALGRIGDAGQIETIARFLDAEDSNVRRLAYFALARIGTPEVLPWLDHVLAPPETGSDRGWWRPPEAGEWLALARRPVIEGEVEKAREAERWQEAERLYHRPVVRLVEDTEAGDGTSYLIFPHRLLGSSTDLWIAEVDAEGLVGPARFSGVSFARLAGTRGLEEVELEARIEGRTLILRAAGAGRGIGNAAVDLDALARDRDDDGLTDLVETRLGTDPERADTDGDGLRDAVDYAPTARIHRDLREEDEIRLAIVEQYFALQDEDRRRAPVVVLGDRALEWRRRGLTLTLDESESRRLLERLGPTKPETLRIELPPDKKRAGFESRSELEKRLELDAGAGERLYVLSFHRGPLSAQGLLVVVRPIAGRWVVRTIDPWWIS